MNFKLLSIYAKVPGIECKGLCHTGCGPIHASTIELDRMQAAGAALDPPIQIPKRMIKDPGPLVRANNTLQHDHHNHLVIDEKTHVCPMLDRNTKRCRVYNQRPLICRVFGVAEGLECPYGCKSTTNRYLTKEEFFDLCQALEDAHPSAQPSTR